MMSQIEKEFEENDKNNLWPVVYQKIKNEASLKSISAEHSVTEARKPENRSRNRYRDVSPYDHSRVILQRGECDYINASLIEVPECNRRYILSQGPLEHTAGQFWQMVWEQNTKAVIMLNRVIEKGTLKCHQYWPLGEDDGEDDMTFDDVGLKVTLMEEQSYEHYIVRTFDLEDTQSGDSREVLHFHYITWPDFGVPSSPNTFLNFLDAVREQGVLEADVGPAVIHCSAGIGRSGTFCLVDSTLLLVEKTGTLHGIDVRSLLITMRTFRMGLIQTPDQLRFSYLAIIEGSKAFVKEARAIEVNDVLEEYLDMSGACNKEDEPPPPPKRTSSLSPTKPKQTPPSPRPESLTPEEEEAEAHKDEPPSKRSKTESSEKLDKTPTQPSPEKPPRTFQPSSENTDNLSDAVSRHFVGNSFDSANNNPEGKSGTSRKQVSGDSDQGTGEPVPTAARPELLDKSVGSQSVGNATAEGASETVLRQRWREERKKKTQEMIQNMKEKQKQSETWKKRKTYYKPLAIGITLLIGGLLFYKFCL